MSILLDLSSDLCHVTLYEWLEPESWCKLDSACCSKLHRPKLLEQFHLFPPVKIFLKSWKQTPYAWCYSRDIFLKSLQIVPCCFTEDGDLRGKFHTEKLEGLEVIRLPPPPYGGLSVINTCMNLRSLSVSNGKVVCHLNVKILQQLTELNLDRQGFSNSCLALIRDHCTKLKKFACFTVESIKAAFFGKIIQRNPSLEYLCITSNSFDCGPILRAISKSCPLLSNLALVDVTGKCDMQFSLTDIAAMQAACPQLSHIWIRNDLESLPLQCAFTWMQNEAGNKLNLYYYDKADLSEYLSTVRNLSDVFLSGIVSPDLRAIAANNKRLLSLSLVECVYDSAALRDLLVQCVSVSELKLQHLTQLVREADLLKAFSVPNSLVFIGIGSGCLTSDCMVKLVSACSHLVEARFYGIGPEEDISGVLDFLETHRNTSGQGVAVELFRAR